MISNQHLRDVVVGDFWSKKGEGEFHIRLFGESKQHNGRIMWVDFQIFEVAGQDHVPSDLKLVTVAGAVVTEVDVEGGTITLGPDSVSLMSIETGRSGRKFFNRKGATSTPDPVYSYEEAGPIVEGFVKWDGCTQFDFPEGVHIDGRYQLSQLLAAVERARELAAEAMPTEMIAAEYR